MTFDVRKIPVSDLIIYSQTLHSLAEQHLIYDDNEIQSYEWYSHKSSDCSYEIYQSDLHADIRLRYTVASLIIRLMKSGVHVCRLCG